MFTAAMFGFGVFLIVKGYWHDKDDRWEIGRPEIIATFAAPVLLWLVILNCCVEVNKS